MSSVGREKNGSATGGPYTISNSLAHAAIPRYRAGAVVWEPFALAILMGLLVSAAIYFIVMWPQVEPEDDDADEGEASKE